MDAPKEEQRYSCLENEVTQAKEKAAEAPQLSLHELCHRLSQLLVSGCSHLIDLGCGNGSFLSRFIHDERVNCLIGLDISASGLNAADSTIRLQNRVPNVRSSGLFKGLIFQKNSDIDLHADVSPNAINRCGISQFRLNPLNTTLLNCRIKDLKKIAQKEPEKTLQEYCPKGKGGFLEHAHTFACTCIEVIEHNTLSNFPEMHDAIFNFLQPGLVVLTTPCKDFNPVLALVSNQGSISSHRGSRRHPDHKFEWSRSIFREYCGSYIVGKGDLVNGSLEAILSNVPTKKITWAVNRCVDYVVLYIGVGAAFYGSRLYQPQLLIGESFNPIHCVCSWCQYKLNQSNGERCLFCLCTQPDTMLYFREDNTFALIIAPHCRYNGETLIGYIFDIPVTIHRCVNSYEYRMHCKFGTSTQVALIFDFSTYGHRVHTLATKDHIFDVPQSDACFYGSSKLYSHFCPKHSQKEDLPSDDRSNESLDTKMNTDSTQDVKVPSPSTSLDLIDVITQEVSWPYVKHPNFDASPHLREALITAAKGCRNVKNASWLRLSLAQQIRQSTDNKLQDSAARKENASINGKNNASIPVSPNEMDKISASDVWNHSKPLRLLCLEDRRKFINYLAIITYEYLLKKTESKNLCVLSPNQKKREKGIGFLIYDTLLQSSLENAELNVNYADQISAKIESLLDQHQNCDLSSISLQLTN